MSDIIDQANNLAEMQREQALANAKKQSVQPRLLDDDRNSDERYCYDCDELIPAARLLLLPEATLCVACTEIREKAYL